jgi:DNA-directed RNA polymerase II subunit RPB4
MSNRTSRPKPPPPGNEEASASLNLGEFQHVDTLTLSEAALVLNALVAKRRNDRKNVNETEYVKSCLLGELEIARGGQTENRTLSTTDC